MGTVLSYFAFRLTVPIDMRRKIWNGKGMGTHCPNFDSVILFIVANSLLLMAQLN